MQKIIEQFNKAIEAETNSDKIAELEVLREYFTNPEFKKNLETYTYRINSK